MSDAVADFVVKKIEEHGEQAPGTVTLDSDLATLGIHSLELTEIIFDIEDHYGVQVEMNTAEAWNSLHTVGDIVQSIHKLIAQKD